jgi:hypothetical protein
MHCLLTSLCFLGYNMRTHIAKSLQSRAKAIRNAVKEYNQLAAPIGRPTLDWTKVSHYSFLDEFNLLRDTRDDISKQPWADPVIRETMRRYQRLQRAKEEVSRCNIELRRLHTSIIDEHHFFDSIVVDKSKEPLAREIKEHIGHRRAVNHVLLGRIITTYSLDGFSRDRTPGVRKGGFCRTTNATSSNTVPITSQAPLEGVEDLENEGDEPDDDAAGDLGNLIDFMTNIS